MPLERCKKKKNKSGEQRLNLNRSWHKDHSHAYNTSFCFKSYTKDLSFPIFVIALEHNGPDFGVRRRAAQYCDLGPKARVIRDNIGKAAYRHFQHGFGLRGVQP